MKDDGTLEPGDYTLEFDSPGLDGDMVLTIADDRRVMTSFYRWHDAGKVTRATVAFDHRPCRFGGSRTFFICPACQKRVMNLALLPRGLRCGGCGKIVHQRLQRRATLSDGATANRCACYMLAYWFHPSAACIASY